MQVFCNMSIDLPDYTRKMILELISTKSLIGILSKRLVCPYSIDDNGEVIKYIDFSNGLRTMWIEGGAAGLEYGINTTYFVTSGYSFFIKTTGSAFVTYFFYTLINRCDTTTYGFEIRFSSSRFCTAFSFELIIPYKGKNLHFHIKYYTASHQLKVFDTDGEYLVLTTKYKLSENLTPSNIIKFVVDVQSEEYIKAMVNEEKVNISGYKCDTYDPVSDNAIQISFKPYYLAMDNIIYIDNIIVTKNEVS